MLEARLQTFLPARVVYKLLRERIYLLLSLSDMGLLIWWRVWPPTLSTGSIPASSSAFCSCVFRQDTLPAMPLVHTLACKFECEWVSISLIGKCCECPVEVEQPHLLLAQSTVLIFFFVVSTDANNRRNHQYHSP